MRARPSPARRSSRHEARNVKTTHQCSLDKAPRLDQPRMMYPNIRRDTDTSRTRKTVYGRERVPGHEIDLKSTSVCTRPERRSAIWLTMAVTWWFSDPVPRRGGQVPVPADQAGRRAWFGMPVEQRAHRLGGGRAAGQVPGAARVTCPVGLAGPRTRTTRTCGRSRASPSGRDSGGGA